MGSRWASSSAISSWALRLGASRPIRSSEDTPSALARASIWDNFGSRRPFSSSESTDGARPTRSPSSASVSPLVFLMCRSRCPKRTRSRPLSGKVENSFSAKVVTSSSYTKICKFSGTRSLPQRHDPPEAGTNTRGRHASGGPVNNRRLEGNKGFDDQVAELQRSWAADSRWDGTERTYAAADVVKLRGSVQEENTLARLGAERLWSLLHTEDYVHALGALTGNQAVQQVKAGLKAIYLSGWQVAADANLAAQTYPDQSLYPVNSVPQVVRRINNALLRTP